MNRSCGLFVGAIGIVLGLQFPAALAAQQEQVLHSFGSGMDGAAPESGLIDMNGTLYGTTGDGGSTGCYGNHGCGTVFALDPSTAAERVVYAFCSRKNCKDGRSPFAGVINVNGKLYGTTTFGGAYGYGTVFAVDPTTGAEKVLHSFGSAPDGLTPFAGLIDMKGTLYGTTQGGGTGCAGAGCGTAFALDRKTGRETVLYSFCSQQNCTDGGNTLAGLVDVNGTLYGTAAEGGAKRSRSGGAGAVFSLAPATGVESVIHSFCGQPQCGDGRYPWAGLIDVHGVLYGTTTRGGGTSDCRSYLGCGAVFALDPNSGKETPLYAFCSQPNCADGYGPTAGLVDGNGTLYGTTLYGGHKGCSYHTGCGTVFALDPDTGVETVLYAFCIQKNCTDGQLPQGGVIDVNGTLYGTTVFGGAYGGGTVFAINATGAGP